MANANLQGLWMSRRVDLFSICHFCVLPKRVKSNNLCESPVDDQMEVVFLHGLASSRCEASISLHFFCLKHLIGPYEAHEPQCHYKIQTYLRVRCTSLYL